MNPQTVADWLIFNGIIVTVICAVLWGWDCLGRWAEGRVMRDVDRALDRSLDAPSSLDVAADRHEAYPTRPMHHWRP